MQMIIQRSRPLAPYHLEGPAFCKWSSGGTGLLQMTIRRVGLLQMIIRRAAAVRGGIGDSRSCMKTDFFLRKIRFRTLVIIISGQKYTQNSQKVDRKWGRGPGSTLTVSLTVKYFLYESPKVVLRKISR